MFWWNILKIYLLLQKKRQLVKIPQIIPNTQTNIYPYNYKRGVKHIHIMCIPLCTIYNITKNDDIRDV